ncbi:S8 family peptidase [Ohtaekwangia sp.]|uniref:S8 family peptidase n=1 Tax=Ohtaekwangia sp. TaxID=2066019 RepID=UPI002FDCDB65
MVWSRAVLMVTGWLITTISFAQVNRYMVFFTDKAGTSYSITNPSAFLSQRAIDRRVQQGIEITEQDLPVDEEYVQAVRETGANVYYRTRWYNGVLIQCDASLITTVQALPFVDHTELVAPGAKLLGGGRVEASQETSRTSQDVTTPQLHMVGIDQMHTAGFRGEGMIIGIFDSGFEGVDVNAPFQPIFSESRIDLQVSHDFVYNTKDIFQYDEHGAEVFSVIAAYQEGTFTGGAYKADYQLYVTEDVSTEYRIEEYNWLFAAERADSAGVDVISSSLGYNTFDDASMDYPKSAMDGKTTVAAHAAQWAADRGIVIVCSAGNEGASAWQIITTPADAVDVLAVAAVTSAGARVAFSSKGPGIKGVIKPDVAAMGFNTVVILTNGSIGTVSGTSLSAPIITSLVTGVWQHYPSLTNKEVLNVIRASGSQAKSPDNLLGYGIPNYETVESLLKSLRENPMAVYPNPVTENIVSIKPFSTAEITSCEAQFISTKGQLLLTVDLSFSKKSPSQSIDVTSLAAGIYILRIHWEDQVVMKRISILR